MKPVCVPCQRFFRVEKTGFYFVEQMPRAASAEPGNAEPQHWKPYKLWSGDRWKCPDCGATIVVGVSGSPIAEHYQPQFSDMVKQLNATLTVNDC